MIRRGLRSLLGPAALPKGFDVTGGRDAAWLALPPCERIASIGHRAYVGGEDPEAWYGIGRLQFHFLVAQGLRPDHVFLDVACGALRLGQFLIPYLDPGRYFGLDVQPELVEAARGVEISEDLLALKRPVFGFNGDFDVSFADPFDAAIAQSLFTHMGEADIAACFAALRPRAKRDARFWFIWFEGASDINPTGQAHANMGWRFPFETMAGLAAQGGWRAERIGDWNHPRGQKIALARPV